MYTQRFSECDGFVGFTHADPDTGDVYHAPFPVAVVGLDKEVLGAGIVIGAFLDEHGGTKPVVVVEDDDGPIEFLGDEELIWLPGLSEGVIGELVSAIKNRKMVRASHYLESVRG